MELFPTFAGPIFGSLLGGLFGGDEASKGQTQTEQKTLDPRIAKYLYGDNGNAGLMGHTSDLYQKQLGQGGLNPMQNAGLEMQRQAYTDPKYGQSFGNMRDIGMGMMSGGAAGNPFNQGGRMGPMQNMGLPSPQIGPGNSGQATSAAYQPIAPAPAYQAPTATPEAAQPVASQAGFEDMMQQYLKANNYQQFEQRFGEGGGGQ